MQPSPSVLPLNYKHSKNAHHNCIIIRKRRPMCCSIYFGKSFGSRGSHSLIISFESDKHHQYYFSFAGPVNAAMFNCMSLYLLSRGKFCLVGEMVPGLKSSSYIEILL